MSGKCKDIILSLPKFDNCRDARGASVAPNAIPGNGQKKHHRPQKPRKDNFQTKSKKSVSYLKKMPIFIFWFGGDSGNGENVSPPL